ncbi:MAG: hypothetical protein HZB38_11280 [Planctomycetes bacterium]|nr:hypothetical protein [Planctomycetota bacterium]
MTNSGAGTARNLRITSAEPQIVENERNLLIDFDIIGTQVGTQPVSPSLTVELGDVGPGDTAAARWLFISSLQGEFIAYDATFEHLTGLGDPRLSLIDSVDIFSLNHVVLADDPDDAMPDFLTDDIPDVGDLPDRLHRSNGTVDPVSVVTNPNVMADVPNLSVAVTAAIGGGWTYVRFDDPIPPGYELASVTRGDGQLLLLNYNAWQTDRINRFLPGSPRERYVHLFDHGGPGTYTIQYRRHCIGDLDQDGSVGINDLSILLSFFGTADGATPERGDLDEDGDIDLGDLALLLSRFGSMCY